MNVEITKIKVGQRFRKDMGDLETLKASIKERGLFHPIVVDSDLNLLAGERRLAACRSLGWQKIPVTTISTDTPVHVERDENMERKQFTETEAWQIAKALMPIEKAKAKERMVAGVPSEKFSEGKGETMERVAAAVGRSRPTLEKIGKIVESGRQDLIEQMDRTGKVDRVYKIIQREERSAQIKAETAKAAEMAPPKVQLCDAIKWLKKQQPADLLLTDPPYMTDVYDVDAFADSWLRLALSKVKKTGRAYIFIGAYPDELLAYLRTALPTQVLVWTYRNTLGPSPSQGYKQNWQAILYYEMPDAPPLRCPEMVEQFSVQDINAPDGRIGDRYHAWQKPLEIAERFIRHSTQKGDKVLDPFCCTGTFLLAASKLGRTAKGCDNSEDNLKIAVERGCIRE